MATTSGKLGPKVKKSTAGSKVTQLGSKNKKMDTSTSSKGNKTSSRKSNIENVPSGARQSETIISYKHKNSIPGPPSICYRLSDPQFIDSGWTILPPSKDTMQLITYQAKEARPNFNWFSATFENEENLYKNGKIFSKFNSNGKAEVFYPNGKLALALTPKKNGGRCVTVMSPGGKDKRGIYQKPVLLAVFDSFGHGIIYNEHGIIRLKYTQTEGTLHDTPSGLPLKWRWAVALEIDRLIQLTERRNSMNKAEKATLEYVQTIFALKESMTRATTKDGRSKDPVSNALKDSNEEGSNHNSPSSKGSFRQRKENISIKKRSSEKIDFNNLSKDTSINKMVSNEGIELSDSEKKQIMSLSKKKIKDVITPVKFIVLKINQFLAFRLLDQSNIHLNFNALNQFLHLELGVHIDPTLEAHVEVVDTL